MKHRPKVTDIGRWSENERPHERLLCDGGLIVKSAGDTVKAKTSDDR
jgi:hypothetical protein